MSNNDDIRQYNIYTESKTAKDACDDDGNINVVSILDLAAWKLAASQNWKEVSIGQS